MSKELLEKHLTQSYVLLCTWLFETYIFLIISSQKKQNWEVFHLFTVFKLHKDSVTIWLRLAAQAWNPMDLVYWGTKIASLRAYIYHQYLNIAGPRFT